VDAESAASRKCRFRQRFAYLESKAEEKGHHLSELSLEEMDELWEAARTKSKMNDFAKEYLMGFPTTPCLDYSPSTRMYDPNPGLFNSSAFRAAGHKDKSKPSPGLRSRPWNQGDDGLITQCQL
jgi:hypothetical protein